MYGKNKIEKLSQGDGKKIRVVSGSPFLTLQGEGPYSGHSAVFVRLHGCHLRCTFCDTEFDSPNDPEVNVFDLVQQVMVTRGRFTRLVVITGGEPMRQNILPLCTRLHDLGFTVQIETAGTFWISGIETVAEIVCSPKTPTIHDMVLCHAKAFKYVISGGMDFGGGRTGYVPTTATQPGARPAQLALPREGAPVYLSPCDEGAEEINSRNRRLVGQLAIMYGVIAGVQLHKFMELD